MHTKVARLASIDIRNGRLSREEGMRLLKEYDGKRPASLDLFLRYVGITEDEFMSIAMQHWVEPWVPDLVQIKHGKPLHDQDRWDRTTGPTPR